MRDNKNLHIQKKNKKDEFYTQLSDIENELRHYKQHFKNKVVFCNCDDPYESNFFKYFAMNFNNLGLKKLIATGYATSPVAGREINMFTGEVETPKNQSFAVCIDEVKDLNSDGRIDLEDVKILLTKNNFHKKKLKGETVRENGKEIVYPAGDFRSSECIKLLKEADIVCTNPPFSLFREYMNQLIKYNKKFLVIGNVNAIQCKEIFPLIKENKVWFGYKFNGKPMLFTVPDYYELSGNVNGYLSDGTKYIGVGGTCWYTNLDIQKRHEDLDLYKEYSPEDYPKYDNLDAINVNKTSDIPYDYDGVMGVPITFLNKYNPNQFEIIGIACGNSWANYRQTLEKLNFDPNIKYGGGLGTGVLNGKAVYGRLLIKRKPTAS